MDEITRKRFTDNSEVAWNEAASMQKQHNFDRLKEAFKNPGFSSLPEVRLRVLREHGIEGKSVFQPCCNKGLDLLSLKNLGADRCFGFDIAREFIALGQELAAAGRIDCELIQANVYELDDSRNGQFDIGLITLGTFMWMPDLKGFFAALKPLFRKNGWLFIHEFHPICEVTRVTQSPDGPQIQIVGNYFNDAPNLWTKGLDYLGGKTYEATPTHRFLHKMSDIIQALADNGFIIESFGESQVNLKERVFGELDVSPLPSSYTLTANYRAGN